MALGRAPDADYFHIDEAEPGEEHERRADRRRRHARNFQLHTAIGRPDRAAFLDEPQAAEPIGEFDQFAHDAVGVRGGRGTLPAVTPVPLVAEEGEPSALETVQVMHAVNRGTRRRFVLRMGAF